MSKRGVICAFLALLMCCSSFVALADEGNAQDEFDTIELFLTDAMDADENGDTEMALSNLSRLIAYYEKDTDRQGRMDKYPKAKQYYYYALGRVELVNGEYAKAEQHFNTCGSVGFETDAYRNYARGMKLHITGDDKGAIEALRTAMSSEALSAVSLAVLEECEEAYFTSAMDSARKLCNKGDHEGAQTIYREIIELLNFGTYETEASAAMSVCLMHNSEEPNTEVSLEIKNAYAVGEDSVKLRWHGIPEDYTVYWGMDLRTGVSREGMERTDVTGYECTVTGLKSGTEYRFVVDHAGTFQEIVVSTKTPSPYELDGYEWTGSSTVYRFDDTRYEYLDSGMKPWEFTKEKKLHKLAEKQIDLTGKPIFESCILVVFTTMELPDTMHGRSYEIRLHIEDNGTVIREGVFGDGYVASNGGSIYLLLYDILDETVDRYGQLTGIAYKLDLVMDGMLVGSASGMLK